MQLILLQAKPFLISKNVEGLLDPSLGGVHDAEQLNRIVMVASLCIQQSSTERPQMSQARPSSQNTNEIYAGFVLKDLI